MRRQKQVDLIERAGETYVKLTDLIDTLLIVAETTGTPIVKDTMINLADKFGDLIEP